MRSAPATHHKSLFFNGPLEVIPRVRGGQVDAPGGCVPVGRFVPREMEGSGEVEDPIGIEHVLLSDLLPVALFVIGWGQEYLVLLGEFALLL